MNFKFYNSVFVLARDIDWECICVYMWNFFQYLSLIFMRIYWWIDSIATNNKLLSIRIYLSSRYLYYANGGGATTWYPNKYYIDCYHHYVTDRIWNERCENSRMLSQSAQLFLKPACNRLVLASNHNDLSLQFQDANGSYFQIWSTSWYTINLLTGWNNTRRFHSWLSTINQNMNLFSCKTTDYVCVCVSKSGYLRECYILFSCVFHYKGRNHQILELPEFLENILYKDKKKSNKQQQQQHKKTNVDDKVRIGEKLPEWRTKENTKREEKKERETDRHMKNGTNTHEVHGVTWNKIVQSEVQRPWTFQP